MIKLQKILYSSLHAAETPDETEEFLQIHSLLDREQRTKMRSNLTVKDNNSRSFTIEFKLDTGAEANVLPYRLYCVMWLWQRQG